MTLSRRDFMKVSAAVAGVGVVSSLGVSLSEPHSPVVNHILIILDRLPAAFNGFRIAQLSDIHFNSFMTPEHLEKVIALVNAQKPDIVMLTGDFVTLKAPRWGNVIDAAGHCAVILRKLKAPQGSLAVLGNHDSQAGANAMSDVLSASGIGVLRNQTHTLERDGARVHLVGIDCVTAGHARPEKALAGVPQDECRIAAVHEPDLADELQKFSVDFQISGHSHGGQIRIPGATELVLPPYARKYPKGAYRLGAMQLYTNSGIGVIGLPMRFRCPPEVSIFELRTPGTDRG